MCFLFNVQWDIVLFDLQGHWLSYLSHSILNSIFWALFYLLHFSVLDFLFISLDLVSLLGFSNFPFALKGSPSCFLLEKFYYCLKVLPNNPNLLVSTMLAIPVCFFLRKFHFSRSYACWITWREKVYVLNITLNLWVSQENVGIFAFQVTNFDQIS